MTIQSQLDQVLALAEKATKDDFYVYAEFNVMAGDGSSATNLGGTGDNHQRNTCNAAYLVAAANFLREHGPAIRAAVGGEAVAWMLRRKRDDFVRGCYATKPTAESLEFAELDGDYYTPLYASPTATVDVGALAELERKARCWDDLQEARNKSKQSPDDSGWKKTAREQGLIPGVRACRAALGLSLSEARDCVEGYLAALIGEKA